MAERRDYLQKLVPLGKILSLIWPLDYPRAKLPSDNPTYIKGNRKRWWEAIFSEWLWSYKLVEKKIHKNRSYVKT